MPNPKNMEPSKRIEQLEWQIKTLADKQSFFNDNISKLQSELKLLKEEFFGQSSIQDSKPKTVPKAPVPVKEKSQEQTVVQQKPTIHKEVEPSVSKRVSKTQKARTIGGNDFTSNQGCLLYTSPSPRDRQKSRMPSSA